MINVIPDFVVMNAEQGMSPITAVIITGLAFAGGVFIWYSWTRHNETDCRVEDNTKTITEIRIELATVSSKVSSVDSTVRNIDKNLNDFQKTTQRSIMKLLEKGI